MKCIVLAAGEGSRLRPLTNDRPKCMVDVDNHPLLESQLAVLRSVGVQDVVLIKGYMADTLNPDGIRSYTNHDYRTTNMVATLFCARSEMTETAIVSYGDIVYSPSVLRELIDSPHDVSVVIDKDWLSYWRQRFDDPLEDAETLRIDTDGLIAEIGQKPSSLDAIEGQYIGLMKFTVNGFAQLKEAFDGAMNKNSLRGKPPANAYMTDILQSLIDSDIPVHPVFIRGQWIEVDSPNDRDLPATIQRLEAILAETSA